MVVIGRGDERRASMSLLVFEEPSPIGVLAPHPGKLLNDSAACRASHVTERDDPRSGILQRVEIVCAAASGANHGEQHRVAGRQTGSGPRGHRKRTRDGGGTSEEGSAAQRVARRTQTS